MSIHELKGVISDLENRLLKFKPEPITPKDQAIIDRQRKLIIQLSNIYREFEGFSLYDTAIELQKAVDNMNDVDGVIVKIYFKENAKSERFGYVNLYP